MCECTSVFRTTYNTNVCDLCGIERPIPLDIFERIAPRHMSPFPVGYSRCKRFTKILDSVLYPSPSPADKHMLEFLWGQTIKTKFDSIAELLNTMKKANTRDKRYISLHCFARLFVNGYKKPTNDNYVGKRKCILNEFEHILFGHLRYCANEQFFNYSWLLCVLLQKYELGNLVVFVKNLRCSHRKDFYRGLLKQIRHSYTLPEVQVCASKTRKPPSEQSDGRRLLRVPILHQSTTCEALLHRYIRDRTGENRSGCGGSCLLHREGKSSGEGGQTHTPRPGESV
jgi:hypothetical protein